MFRLPGPSSAIREAVPAGVTDAFALLTHLGDPLFLLVLVAVYYWFSDNRSEAALLVAYTLVAVAITVALKEGLALPRPPAEVRAVAEYSDSYGFPSGHAIGATVVYGGLVAIDERLRNVRPMIVVGTLVALIGLSRVVIGVHYLGDILVGHLVGVCVLAALWMTDQRYRVQVAAAAVVFAIPAVLVSSGGEDALFALGGSLGAVAVFTGIDIDELPAVGTVPAGAGLLVFGSVAIGATYELALALGHVVVLAVAGAVMIGGALTLPAVLDAFPAGQST